MSPSKVGRHGEAWVPCHQDGVVNETRLVYCPLSQLLLLLVLWDSDLCCGVLQCPRVREDMPATGLINKPHHSVQADNNGQFLLLRQFTRFGVDHACPSWTLEPIPISHLRWPFPFLATQHRFSLHFAVGRHFSSVSSLSPPNCTEFLCFGWLIKEHVRPDRRHELCARLHPETTLRLSSSGGMVRVCSLHDISVLSKLTLSEAMTPVPWFTTTTGLAGARPAKGWMVLNILI